MAVLPGVHAGIIGGSAGGKKTLLQIITDAGLTSNLQLVLDPADSASYSGSGQTWTDVSTNAAGYFRGTSSSSEASDPTFNGTAGALDNTDFWSYDGGDFFTKTSAIATWENNLHKSGWAFSLIAMINPSTLNDIQYLFFTQSSGLIDGVNYNVSVQKGGRQLNVTVNNHTGIHYQSNVANLSPASPPDSVYFVALSYAIGTGNTGTYILNNLSASNLSTTQSAAPSTNSGSTPLIGKQTSGYINSNGQKIYGMAMWNTNLSLANLKTLQQNIKTARGFGWTNA